MPSIIVLQIEVRASKRRLANIQLDLVKRLVLGTLRRTSCVTRVTEHYRLYDYEHDEDPNDL